MSHEAHFDGDPASVPAARRFVDAALVKAGMSESLRARAKLVVSELATNTVQHAGTGFTLTVLAAGAEVRIEVRDPVHREPVLRKPAPTDLRGRGLLVVDTMSDSWGVDLDRLGKTVWAVLSTASPAVWAEEEPVE